MSARLKSLLKESQKLHTLFDAALPFLEQLSDNPTDENLELKANILNWFSAENQRIESDYIDYFNGMNRIEMKEIFLGCDEETLRYICNDLAESREMYEICQAVKDVLEERNLSL